MIIPLSLGAPSAGTSAYSAAASDFAVVEPPLGSSHESKERVQVSSLPKEFQAIASWAVDLFDEAGLELPPLRFAYHGDDFTPCLGRIGAHRVVDEVSTIEICTTATSVPTEVMILHELAHTWTYHRLPEDRKLAFQRLRGWEYWRNYDAAPWHENGTEQAAEILVWGLIDRPIGVVRIYQNSCDELLEGYRTLTALEPLHGYQDHCDRSRPPVLGR